VDERRSLGSAFSALLTATFLTNLGDGLRLAALPLLATTLTSSPILISGITVAQFLPWAVFAPFGGVIVDRADRRRLIMITQAWRALVMAALAVLVVADVVQIWQLFGVAFMITVGEILVDPSVVATVPSLVSSDDLDKANSRISTVEVVTNDFVGGPVGAATFGLVPWLPFLVDALSYLGSVLPFSRLPSAPPSQVDKAVRSPIRVEMGDGLRWIREHPFLRPLTLGIAVFHSGTAGAFSLLVLFVTDVLDAPGITFGIVLAASAIGATLATLVATQLVDRFSRRTVITGAAVLSSVSVLAVGGVTSAWQLVIVWALNGASGGVLLSIGRGFIQRHTPNDRLGRTAIASLHLVGSMLLWRSFRHEPA